MIRLEVALLPTGPVPDVAVVIDVLRMTTTAATLFSRGLDELFVVADTTEALSLAETCGAMLLGERHGLPYPGFHGGNSPLEHLAADLSGRSAILCTTNGSKAVEAAGAARHLLLGAIVNARSVAERAAELASEEITLVCAGTDGQPSLDDLLGAGCIAREALRLLPHARPSDAARIALMLAERPAGVGATLREAGHAETLSALGFAEDVEFAGRCSAITCVAERQVGSPARFVGGR